MWSKVRQILGFLMAVAVIVAYICFASHLSQKHRAEQKVEEVVINLMDSTETRYFTSSAEIRKQLERGKLKVEGRVVDSVDAVTISRHLTRNGFVRNAEVYATYSGEVHINVYQHKPVLRLLCNGYNSYVTADGTIFKAPKGSACYIPVVTGEYRPLFAPSFEGKASDNLKSLLDAETKRLDLLTAEYSALNKKRSEVRETRKVLRKSRDKKKFNESADEYKIRKTALNKETEECDKALLAVEQQKGKLIEKRRAIDKRKQKLQREYDDFVALINFVAKISEESFWGAEVVQLVANRNSTGDISLRLVPRSGSFVVEFGVLNNSEEKLEKLQVFYDKGLSHIGWSQYKVVDVRFDKQVICTE